MRLRRLDLIRYGHFTDRSFTLPAAESDFHIVFGPNEAGKSTALCAIEDLLFGIPMHSPYGFLHDYTRMRIGAVLENRGDSLEVLRRKGNKDTLLGPEGTPVAGGESMLRPYLAGADRPFFERMFSLDHTRLTAGGQEILEAKDDVGQMLFSAGAGIGGLREQLAKLTAEGDELWSARRAKHRRFYVASDRLGEANRDLRDQTFTASKWRELKRDYEQADQAYAEIDKGLKELIIERNRLNRIRRVFRDLRRKQALDAQRAELGDVIDLPEDATEVLAQAERQETEATTRIETLLEQLKRTNESLNQLSFDETLVQRAEDIGQLHERRIEIRREKADLPKREAELNTAEEQLRGLAAELGWNDSDSATLIERIPPRTKLSVVRSLLSQKGELEADVAATARLLDESQEALADLQRRLEAVGEPADVAHLAIVIKTIREQGDVVGRIRSAKKAVGEGQGLVERRLKALNPSVSNEQGLTDFAVPARTLVQEHREREEDWTRRQREARQQVASVQQERDAAVAALDRTVRDQQIITAEALNDARSRRDELWQLVKRKHIGGEPISEEQLTRFNTELDDLAGCFESAVVKADMLADRRFDHAEAAGRLAEIKRKIGELETLLQQFKGNDKKLVAEGEQLKAEWTSTWSAASFAPLAAGAMLEWMDARDKVMEAMNGREQAQSTLQALNDEEGDARASLLHELAAIGVGVADLKNDGLPALIERANTEYQLRKTEADAKAQLERELEEATKRKTRRARDHRAAMETLEAWRRKWSSAVGDLALAADTTTEAVSVQIDVIDQMRETAGQINNLRHDRIDKIKRDVADFEQVVEVLVRAAAGDLAGNSADDAVVELETRLAEAKQAQALQARRIQEADDLSKQIAKREGQQRELAASIAHLKQAAGVETNEALKQAIGQSDRKRSLEQEHRLIIETLQQDGDGNSIDLLEQECDGLAIDDVVGREASVQAELDDLQQQQADAAEQRSQARQAFQAVGGDDAAARAAAAKEEALTEMREVAGRYVRVKTSALLLQWAIDRYRREKQAPLLKRAGELFAIMSDGSFSGLEVAFDNQDNAQLTGVRPNGRVVPVSGMSTGSADQLYLALRIASIEDYLERAQSLPFVADDLFINFDDERAAAGFRLLGELSKITQVLFFTHHQHLVDVARSTFGSSVNVVSLTEQSAGATA